ncbi:hypothetical protein JCGZ_09993 [Jatropha curcas]|uniref:Aminotransferase-like plant mobile domain-containing protein n=1 Tax=Jatropha curcas TaxID=180498 RepID=A0A067KIS4_JATCU|nr:hypothetical protein JCGZ_09993 [Jatropha curcas]
MRTLDRPGLRASLRATIGLEPTISDKRVRYESIFAHYQEMPRERVAELDMNVVPRACLFYLLSTTLFTNHGNDTNLALILPLQDMGTTKQFNWQAAALSYLYYGINLCIHEAYLKVSYRHVIEVLNHLTGQTTQGMLEMHLVIPYRMSPPGCTHMSISDYNEVRQLKLAVARLSDERVYRANMAPLVGRDRGT